MRIFFNRSFNDFMNASVMTKMNYFYTLALQDTAHDIDGGVMPVKERCGGDQSDFVYRGVAHSRKGREKLMNVS